MGVILGSVMFAFALLGLGVLVLLELTKGRRLRLAAQQAAQRPPPPMAPPVNTAGQGGAEATAGAPSAEGNQHAAFPESPDSPEDKEERIQEEEQNKEEEQLPVLAATSGLIDRIDDWLDSW